MFSFVLHWAGFEETMEIGTIHERACRGIQNFSLFFILLQWNCRRAGLVQILLLSFRAWETRRSIAYALHSALWEYYFSFNFTTI